MLCNREKINTYLNITNDSDKTYDLQIDDNIEFTYKILKIQLKQMYADMHF